MKVKKSYLCEENRDSADIQMRSVNIEKINRMALSFLRVSIKQK